MKNLKTIMSDKPEPSSAPLQPQQQKRRGILPPEIIDLIVAPVKVGSFTGKFSSITHGKLYPLALTCTNKALLEY